MKHYPVFWRVIPVTQRDVFLIPLPFRTSQCCVLAKLHILTVDKHGYNDRSCDIYGGPEAYLAHSVVYELSHHFTYVYVRACVPGVMCWILTD